MSGKTVIDAPEGQRFLTITRSFNAPAALVLRAHLEADLIAQWLGPQNMEMTVTENEPRHGGKWAFIHKDSTGAEYTFRGVFHGDPSLETGIIRTFEYTDYPGEVSLEALTFTEVSGITTVHVVSVYRTQEGRDGTVASGMESGVSEGYERLDALLAGLA